MVKFFVELVKSQPMAAVPTSREEYASHFSTEVQARPALDSWSLHWPATAISVSKSLDCRLREDLLKEAEVSQMGLENPR